MRQLAKNGFQGYLSCPRPSVKCSELLSLMYCLIFHHLFAEARTTSFNSRATVVSFLKYTGSPGFLVLVYELPKKKHRLHAYFGDRSWIGINTLLHYRLDQIPLLISSSEAQRRIRGDRLARHIALSILKPMQIHVDLIYIFECELY